MVCIILGIYSRCLPLHMLLLLVQPNLPQTVPLLLLTKPLLTHWPLGDAAVISHFILKMDIMSTSREITVMWMPQNSLMIQSIPRVNLNPDVYRHMTSSGHNKLIFREHPYDQQFKLARGFHITGWFFLFHCLRMGASWLIFQCQCS